MGLASKLAVMASASGTEDDPKKQLEEKSSKMEASAESSDGNEALQRELDEKWILSLSTHFRNFDREQFSLRNAEAPNKWRRVTVSCDYHDVTPGSLEDDLKVLRYQQLMHATIDRLNSNTGPVSPTRGPPPPPLPNPQVIGHPPLQQAYGGYPPPPAPPPPPPVIDFAKEPTLVQRAGLVPFHYSGDTALCPDRLVRILPLKRHLFLTFHRAQAAELDEYQWLLRYGSLEVWCEKPCKSILKRMAASEPEPVRSGHQQDLRTDRTLSEDAIYNHIPDGMSDARHVSEHFWSAAVLTTPTNDDVYECSSPASTIESATKLIEQFPWPEVVTLPNTLIESAKSKQLVTDAALSGPPDSPPLPEDYLIRSQLWSRRYLPEEWSATDPSETTRDIGVKIKSRLQARSDEYDEKIQRWWSREHGSPMCSYAIPSIKAMSTGRNAKRTCVRIPKSMALPLGGLAVCLPCAAALLNGSDWPGSVRGIVGVISGSSGLSLTSLPTEEDYNALRWLVRLLWAVTYGSFLRCSYLSLRENRPIYLFCSLLLAAHFVFGFAGAAETTEEATKGILMFGPLVATLCAALVYIPFRYRTTNPSSRSGTSRGAEDVETARSGRSSPAPAQRNDGDGDISLGWRVMQGTMGPVV